MQNVPSLSAIPVLFTPRMVAQVDSFSPSAAKPLEVMRAWQRFGTQLDVREPAPATAAQFCAAHERRFVEGVFACAVDNGFHNRSRALAESLPYTSGAMLEAGRAALLNRSIAIAPCSGFHHAGWDHAGGYCTFNGLMVAALSLKSEGLVRRLGILDFDEHWGDGTHDIITRLSIDWIEHYSATEDYAIAAEAERFIQAIPTLAQRFRDCDLVLYQAGADQHIDDPLGGWLTTQQLYQRDLAVFAALRAMGVPVAWNLAGGYQQPLRKVLDVHDNTLLACLQVHQMNTRGATPCL